MAARNKLKIEIVPGPIATPEQEQRVIDWLANLLLDRAEEELRREQAAGGPGDPARAQPALPLPAPAAAKRRPKAGQPSPP